MNKCNRCGRFRSQKTHVCLPVKVIINGKVAYTFMMNTPKKSKQSLPNSKHSTMRTKKKSRLVQGLLVMSVSAVSMFFACNALANIELSSTEMLYIAPKISMSMIDQKEVVVAPNPESIHDKITRYALKWNIPRQDLWHLVGCETSYQWDPKMQSNARYTFDDPKHGIRKGERERSYGLAMIHAPVHDIPMGSITDPDFALDFIGKHWGERHQMWVNCTAKYDL